MAFSLAATFCVAFAVSIASCSNLGGDLSAPVLEQTAAGAGVTNADGATGTAGAAGGSAQAVSGNSLSARVVFPGLPNIPLSASSAAAATSSDAGVARSAFPTVSQLAGDELSFGAVLAQSGGTSYESDGVYDGESGACSFAFNGAYNEDADATYTLTINLFSKSGGSKEKIASGSQSVQVAAASHELNANVSLAPNVSASLKGGISLNLAFEDEGVSTVELLLKNSAGADVTSTYLGGTSVAVSGKKASIASAEKNLPAGIYILLMTFKNGSVAVGSRTESLNIYPGLVTNAWWANGSSSAAGDTLSVSTYKQTEFWVRGTGGKFYSETFTTAAAASDSNAGVFAAPLATVQEAVNRIQTIGDGSTEYTIWIDGEVKGVDGGYPESNKWAFVCIGASNPQKITIKGFSSSDTDIINANQSDASGDATAVYVLGDADVTIENLKITGGNIKGGNGGGIYMGGSGTLTINDCDITGNAAEKYGGGVYGTSSSTIILSSSYITGNIASISGGGMCTGGALTISGGEISDNTATANGGGIGISSSEIATIRGTRIYNNSASQAGGGICIFEKDGNGCEITDATILENTAGTSGGGVYNNSGTLTIAGETIIKENSADSYGGGVCSKDGTFSMTGGTISGNSAPTSGGGIYVSGTLTISGGTVGGSSEGDANTAKYGAGIYNAESGTLTFTNGTISANTAANLGGGIYNNGTLSMTGGEISGNSTTGTEATTEFTVGGGGVFTASSFTMTGGTISGNTSLVRGGGVFVNGSSATFVMGGTAVIGKADATSAASESSCSNSAGMGGAIFNRLGKVYLGYTDASTPDASYSGGLYYNYASVHGGGIYGVGSAAFYCYKGAIRYNTASTQGGAGDFYNGVLSVEGTAVSGNAALTGDGGAFQLGRSDGMVTATFKDAAITENTATRHGNAICVTNANLAFSGSTFVSDDNDIYLVTGRTITVDSSLSAATPVATITPASYGTSVQVLDGGAVGTEHAKFAVTPDSDGDGWAVGADGRLVKVLKPVTMKAGNLIDSLLTGTTLGAKSTATAFAPSATPPADGSETVLLSTDDSELPCYAWLGGTTIYYYAKDYTDGDAKIPLDANSSLMFYNCTKLASIDLSGFDTSNVTAMKQMFQSCYALTSLDVSNFDTSKVTTMLNMFSGCSKLASLDLSKFDTSSVTDMENMFNNCSSLTSLDVSSFDTSKVTKMLQMFSGCSKLASLDVSKFDTSSVTSMRGMFSDCSALTSLDVSNFNTANVTTMMQMFKSCSALTGLDVSGFDTSSVTDISSMFSGCSALTNLDVSSFDTSKVTDISYIFNNCSKLADLDVSKFDTSNVKNMSGMFSNCSALTSLDVRGFNTANVTNMNYMFNGCKKLESIDMSNFDTAKVTTMTSMFYNCTALTSLDVSKFDISAVTNVGSMFSNCASLKTIYAAAGADWSGISSGTSMFLSCTSLKGGNNTAFSSGHTDKTYARIDTTDTPGYFTTTTTGANAASAISTMTDGGTVKISGEVTAAEITDINKSLKALAQSSSDARISLDLSDAQITTLEGANVIGNINDFYNSFVGCTNLESVILPNTLETIGAYAFAGCSNLKSVTIPASVKTIEAGAFSSSVVGNYWTTTLENAYFEETSGWTANAAGYPYQTTTSLSSADLSDSAKAAQYLTGSSVYAYYKWTRN